MQIKEMTYYNCFIGEHSRNLTTWFLGRIDGWAKVGYTSYSIIYGD